MVSAVQDFPACCTTYIFAQIYYFSAVQCTYPKSILQYFLQSNCMTFELNDTFVKCIFKYLVFQQVQYVVFILVATYGFTYFIHTSLTFS